MPCAGVMLSLHGLPSRAEAQDEAVREALRSRVEALRETGRLDVRGSRIASVIVLPDFYERRGFRRAWAESRTIDQLTRAGERGDSVQLSAENETTRRIASASL
jgi:hypothetical protein